MQRSAYRFDPLRASTTAGFSCRYGVKYQEGARRPAEQVSDRTSATIAHQLAGVIFRHELTAGRRLSVTPPAPPATPLRGAAGNASRSDRAEVGAVDSWRRHGAAVRVWRLATVQTAVRGLRRPREVAGHYWAGVLRSSSAQRLPVPPLELQEFAAHHRAPSPSLIAVDSGSSTRDRPRGSRAHPSRPAAPG